MDDDIDFEISPKKKVSAYLEHQISDFLIAPDLPSTAEGFIAFSLLRAWVFGRLSIGKREILTCYLLGLLCILRPAQIRV